MRLVHAYRRWFGRCVVAAPGPSLTEDVAAACYSERVIAVNDAYLRLPWAKAVYSCDSAWWDVHKGAPHFSGERWSSHGMSPRNDKRTVADKYGLHVIAGEDRPGFSLDPAIIHYGNNSGFQAVNLAVLFGADPIVLVGFDMRRVDDRGHFFGEHKAPLRSATQFGLWCARFAKAAQMLGDSPRIINATPGSALTCFPMMPLAEALGMAEAA